MSILFLLMSSFATTFSQTRDIFPMQLIHQYIAISDTVMLRSDQLFGRIDSCGKILVRHRDDINECVVKFRVNDSIQIALVYENNFFVESVLFVKRNFHDKSSKFEKQMWKYISTKVKPYRDSNPKKWRKRALKVQKKFYQRNNVKIDAYYFTKSYFTKMVSFAPPFGEESILTIVDQKDRQKLKHKEKCSLYEKLANEYVDLISLELQIFLKNEP